MNKIVAAVIAAAVGIEVVTAAVAAVIVVAATAAAVVVIVAEVIVAVAAAAIAVVVIAATVVVVAAVIAAAAIAVPAEDIKTETTTQRIRPGTSPGLRFLEGVLDISPVSGDPSPSPAGFGPMTSFPHSPFTASFPVPFMPFIPATGPDPVSGDPDMLARGRR